MRVFFRCANGGNRFVRGELIRRVQTELKNSQTDPGRIDGVYGNDTRAAVDAYQRVERLNPTGALSDETWDRLMGDDGPSLFDRCLQLTADFEGHGFSKLEGNFDGAGLTWGIIGFTLAHGQIQRIISEIRNEHANLVEDAFGALRTQLYNVLAKNRQDQLDWAEEISLGTQRVRVDEKWAEAFERLGAYPEVQAIQLERVRPYWNRAKTDFNRFNLSSERAMALCFDIAVQNGGVDPVVEENRIRRWMNENPGFNEDDLLPVIADVVAENGKPRWIEDVRNRKRTLATGQGVVHGVAYNVEDWAIDGSPAAI